MPTSERFVSIIYTPSASLNSWFFIRQSNNHSPNLSKFFLILFLFDFFTLKNLVLEKNLYEQMSLTASAFSYCWSRWNTVSGTERIIVQAVEQETNKQPLDVSKQIILLMKYSFRGYVFIFYEEISTNYFDAIHCSQTSTQKLRV